jgi:tRNA pseudouridine32 synthase/23S rRNA pseudouridine746 synthase
MNILYVDTSLLAVDKPSGLATIPGGWDQGEASLSKLLEAEYGRLWIVHRLDKVTSGVVVFARTADAHRTLSILFESRFVSKTYRALVNGLPAWDNHTARHRLRPDVGHTHRTAIDHAHGKPASTHFRVLERFAAHSLLEATPETGRTHQVRAHAAALGFPLLGDTLYGAPETGLIARPALHAYSLKFEFEGKPFSFTAPYPEDLVRTLAGLHI